LTTVIFSYIIKIQTETGTILKNKLCHIKKNQRIFSSNPEKTMKNKSFVKIAVLEFLLLNHVKV